MFRTTVFCFLLLTLAATAWCQTEQGNSASDSADQRAKIEAVLASEVAVNFEQTPLRDVVAQFTRTHGVTFTMDRNVFELLGIGDDARITARFDGVRFDDALTFLLRQHSLNWMVRYGMIEITSTAEVEGHLTTVVYDVTDLYRRDPLDAGAVFYSSMLYSGWGHGDFVGLPSLVTRIIEPFSWEELGGPGTCELWDNGGKDLFVALQNYHVHRKLAAFFEKLKRKAPTKHDAAVLSKVITRAYVVTKRAEASPEEVMRLVQVVLADEGWKEDSIQVIAGVIVVKHTVATHKKVGRLLISIDAVVDYDLHVLNYDLRGLGGGFGFGDKTPLSDEGPRPGVREEE